MASAFVLFCIRAGKMDARLRLPPLLLDMEAEVERGSDFPTWGPESLKIHVIAVPVAMWLSTCP